MGNEKRLKIEKVNMIPINNNINSMPFQYKSSKQNKSFEQFLKEEIEKKNQELNEYEEDIICKRR